eukprot:TRINITY_DN2181_c0_g1_i1.p1 TRINITY_DN2181_c0_g1~~TRINITY_DN2181_c0_g1_i1.p1  ORF type:complete len:805 (-),score=117.85 TRINITY_DN2181_c0_g1_i1:35-2449(-)
MNLGIWISLCVVWSWSILRVNGLEAIPIVSNNSIIIGNARFTIETSRVIRMEFKGNGSFVDSPSVVFINRDLAPVSFSYGFQDGLLEIDVKDKHQTTLILTYNSTKGPGFHCDNLNVFIIEPFGFNQDILWCPEKVNTGILNGSVETTDCYIGAQKCYDVYLNRMKKSILSTSGWALVDDSHSAIFTSDWMNGWRKERTGPAIDWHLFAHGLNFTGCLADYTYLSGPIPMAPVRAYGVWWSRYWAYDESGIRDVIGSYVANKIPLHMLVLDIDWHQSGPAVEGCGPVIGRSGCPYGYGGFNWNTTLFPDPVNFQSWVHGQGLQMMLNLHDQCGIDHCQINYASAAKLVGINPLSKQPAMCKFTDELWVRALNQYMLGDEQNRNVDFWWEDYGIEMADYDGEKLSCIDGHCMHCLGDNVTAPVLWSSHIRAIDRIRKGSRGMLLGIYGGLGSHRYPIVGSGDTNADWITLAFEIYLTITASHVGVAWTHDLGGFYDADGNSGGMRDPEMFLRWLQFGALSPWFRTHCSHCEIRIWMYPNYPLLKQTFVLRNSLFPYIYSASRKSYETGLIIVKPMYFQWPLEANAYTFNATQYLFGDSFLVAPITSPIDDSGYATKTIWFPPGKWIHYQSGKEFSGPQVFTLQFGLTDIPLFAVAGSIIPMNPPDQLVQKNNTLLLSVLPGPFGSTHLYEDDGETLAYQSGSYLKTVVSHLSDASTTAILIQPDPSFSRDTSNWLGATRNVMVQFRWDASPTVALCNGVPLPYSPTHAIPGWWYDIDPQTGLQVIMFALGPTDPTNSLVLEVKYV